MIDVCAPIVSPLGRKYRDCAGAPPRSNCKRSVPPLLPLPVTSFVPSAAQHATTRAVRAKTKQTPLAHTPAARFSFAPQLDTCYAPNASRAPLPRHRPAQIRHLPRKCE